MTAASGGIIALLGMGLLAADPRRDWNRVFAVFAVFWGFQILAANAVRWIDDPAVAYPVGLLSLALLVPLYFFVVVFAAIYPRPVPPFGTSLGALAVLLLPAAVDLVLLVMAPERLLAAVVAVPAGGSTMQWGPLFAPLVLAPLYGGFFYALFVMMRRLGHTAHDIERRQVLVVLAALGIFVAYNVSLQSLLFGAAALGGVARNEAVGAVALWIGAVMAVGLVLLVVLVSRLARAWRHAPSRTVAREMRGVLLALAVAAVIGLVEGGVVVGGGPRWAATGVVRMASVGLIVYGVARYQLFDLDLRVKDATRSATTVVLLAVGAVALWGLFRGLGTVPAARGWLVAGAVAVAAFPVAFVVRRLTERILPAAALGADHLYLRKLEVYQVALVDCGWPGPEDPRLVRVRGRLGLGEEDHALAVRLAASRHEEPTRFAPGVVAFDRYLLEAVLGSGTYGRIFLARDLRSGRHVAIKELEARWRGDGAVLARFLREARIMGRLDHPRVVRLFEVERRGEDRYLVMERVDGGTLADRLAEGPLGRDEALRLTDEILDGLEAAHARGVVHRDLKPANVLVDTEGHVRLADFGVASVLEVAAEATFVGLPPPDEAGPVGNLRYMAPEQARGGPLDARADLFAVGAMLYHMLTGRPHRSLDGLSAQAARAAVAEEALPALDPFDEAMRRVLTALLAPGPAARVADATAARRLLAPLLTPSGANGGAAPYAQGTPEPSAP